MLIEHIWNSIIRILFMDLFIVQWFYLIFKLGCVLHNIERPYLASGEKERTNDFFRFSVHHKHYFKIVPKNIFDTCTLSKLATLKWGHNGFGIN